LACLGRISSKLPDRASLSVCEPADERRRWCDGAGRSLKELEEPAESLADARLTGCRGREVGEVTIQLQWLAGWNGMPYRSTGGRDERDCSDAESGGRIG